jgi:hypothetical protein
VKAARTPERSAEAARGRRRGRRFLRRLAWAAAGLAAALGFAVFVVVPWLGRRGDFNHVIESVVASVLEVPVRIDSIETEPLDRLALTRLRFVSAEAAEKLRFDAEELALRYHPIELLRGEVRELRFVRPVLFLNFDEDLSGLAFLPRFPQAPSAQVDSPLALPFTLRHLAIEHGSAVLRFAGRDLSVDELEVAVEDLGSAQGLAYEVRARVLGANVRAAGRIDIVRGGDGKVRHLLPRGELLVDGVRADVVLPWWRSLVSEVDGEQGAAAPGAAGAVAEVLDSGTLSLAGSVEGVWRERLDVGLETRFEDLSTGKDVPLGISDGNLAVKLEAALYGLLDSVSFRLDAEARGDVRRAAGAGAGASASASTEQASLKLRGRVQRAKDGGADLLLEALSARLAAGGEITLSGSALRLDGAGAGDLDLAVSLLGVRSARVLELLPETLTSSLPIELRESRAELTGELSVAGSLASPELAGYLDVRNAALRLPWAQRTLEASGQLELAGLEYDRAAGRGRLASLEFSVDPFEAVDLAAAVASQLPGFPRLLGSAQVELRVGGATFTREAFRGELELAARLDGASIALAEERAVLGGVRAAGTLALGIRSPGSGEEPAPLAAHFEIAADEILAGDVYARLGGEPMRLDVAGALLFDEAGSVARLEFQKIEASTPLTGPVSGSAEIRRGDEARGSSVSAHLEAPRLPAARAFETFVREPYANTLAFLEDASLEGESGVALDLSGDLGELVSEWTFALRDARLVLGDLVVEGIDATVPFTVGPAPRARDGTIDFTSLRKGPFEIARTTLRFRGGQGGFQLLEPLSLALLGGKVELERLSVDRVPSGGAALEVDARGRGLSLDALTRAYGLPVVAGALSFRFAPLRYEDGRLRVDGAVVAAAFGGTVSFSDLELDDVLEPYASLRLGEGSVEGVDLAALGQALRFGIASGVLRGRLQDLTFTAGAVSGFRLDVETVPTPGVPQYIDRRAVESIRRVLSGPLGALEENFFSRFYFHRFGFACELADGIFRLRGKYRDGGADYLMYGRWYQIPRVSIINAEPDWPYDWESIAENLRAIYRGELSLDGSGSGTAPDAGGGKR